MQVEFEAVCGPKVHDISCRRSLVVVNALGRLFRSEDIGR